MHISSITPRRTQRALLMGQTGCGKTTLARFLLASFRNVVVYDPKDQLDWPEYVRLDNLRAVTRAREPRIIYAPNAAELRDPEMQDALFKFIYDRRNTTIYVDEVYALGVGNEILPHYHACLTRGRSLGIATFNSTQRPIDIPQWIMSEAEHFYAFRQKLPQDRKRVYETTGIDPELIHPRNLAEHYFYYSDDRLEVVGPLHLNINGG